MVAIHLPKVPVVLSPRGTQLASRTVATSSVLAVLIIGAVAASVIAIQRRALRRRQLRYRVTQTASRAIHAGLTRSTAAVERVRAKLSG
jgi:hypothetical protein